MIMLIILYFITILHMNDAQISFLGCKNGTDLSQCQDVRFEEELPPGFVVDTYIFDENYNQSLSFKIIFTGQNLGPVAYLSLMSRGSECDLVVTSRIDKEDFETHKRDLNFDIEVSGFKANKFSFNVTIIDVNDNWPVFENANAKCTMKENDPNDKCRGLSVIDRDQIDSKCDLEIIYVSSGSVSDFSLITMESQSLNSTGYRTIFDITLNKNLDYEKYPLIHIQIQAKDSASHATMYNEVVTVTDTPDMPPVFQNLISFKEMDEELPKNTPVLRVVAIDGDRGINSPIKYSLKTGSIFNAYFAINFTTGAITIAKQIDRESADIIKVNGLIDLRVTATETVPSHFNLTEATIKIKITDINDSPAVFNHASYRATIPENSQPGMSVNFDHAIKVFDADSDRNAQYSLMINRTDYLSETFEISPVIGSGKEVLMIRVKNGTLLDYEERQSIKLTIEARQITPTVNTPESSFFDVVIEIVDMNDNSPVFQQSVYRFSIKENSPNQTFVGVVNATDKDSGPNGKLYYFINDSNKIFGINSSSGAILVNVNADIDHTLLNREEQIELPVTVVAVDCDNRMGIATVLIYLNDVNDNRPIFKMALYRANLVENSNQFSSSPLQVQAIDMDTSYENNITRYEIINKCRGHVCYSQHFHINRTSGVVTVRNPIDREKIPNDVIEITIMAFDEKNKNLNDTSKIQIHIQDVNDNEPKFSSTHFSAIINQNISATTPIIFVNASDIDQPNTPQSQIMFKILGKYSEMFVIEESETADKSATIKRNSNSHLKAQKYEFLVQASNPGYPLRATTANVSITVQEINDETPYFNQSLFAFNVAENFQIGGRIGSVFASDNDFNSNLTYGILFNDTKAWNSIGVSVEATCNITNLISINELTGAIYLRSVLDREKIARIVARVRVIDLAAEASEPKQTSFATLEINVMDINDNTPLFQSSVFRFSILENFPERSKVNTGATGYFVSATDPDIAGILQYSLIEPDLSFSIDQKTGEIFLIKPLDREKVNFFNFTVSCNDGTFTINSTVIITVCDVNDNRPYFFDNITEINVSGSVQFGRSLAEFRANDIDEGEHARILFRLKCNTSIKFELSSTGTLTLSGPINLDPNAQNKAIWLTIEIIDNPNGNFHFTNSKNVLVNILDVNYYFPIFNQSVYEFGPITEHAVVNYRIGAVLATDADFGENANITYDLLLSENDADPLVLKFFKAVKIGGQAQIFTKSSLKNRGGRYMMILRGTDNGTPRLHNNCTIIISVVEINNHWPIFTNPTSLNDGKFNITENNLKNISTIAAYDNDTGVNGEIRFNIKSQNGDHEFFFISPITGILSNVRELDREKQDLFKFEILAFDLGSPAHTSSVEVEVKVLDLDDNLPQFPVMSQTIVLSFKEGTQKFLYINNSSFLGFKIGNVAQAIDKDIDENAAIIYQFIEGDRDGFYLDKDSGDLYGIREFDRETKDSYEKIIKAIPKSQFGKGPHPKLPGYSDSNCSQSKIVVNIIDINDEVPRFLSEILLGEILQSSPGGTDILDVSSFVTDEDQVSQNQLIYFIKNITYVPNYLQDSLKGKSNNTIFRMNSTTGILYTDSKIEFQKDLQGYIELFIGVSDGKFTASSQCKIFLVNPNQILLIDIRDSPENVAKRKKDLSISLSKSLNISIRIDGIQLGRNKYGNIQHGLTSLFIHGVDLSSNKVMSGNDLLRQIIQKAPENRYVYEKYKIDNVYPVDAAPLLHEISGSSYKLILFIIGGSFTCLLIIIIIISCAIWSYLKKYQRKLKAFYASSMDYSTISRSTKLPCTNAYGRTINPLSAKNHIDISACISPTRSAKNVKRYGIPVYGNEIPITELYSSLDNANIYESSETIL